MAEGVGQVSHSTRRGRRVSLARRIEHLIEWAEPIIRSVCGEVWRETNPQGLELEDLYQEGRIEVFQAAQKVLLADDPRALVAVVVRRRAFKAVRQLANWDTAAPPDDAVASRPAETPMAAG